MQIIMIALLVILCCPLIILCNFLRPQRRVAADDSILKNLNHIPIEDFRAYKRSLQRKHQQNTSVEIEEDNPYLSQSLLSRQSSELSDGGNLLDEEKADDELECAICLEEFKNGCSVVVLPCKSHTFHSQCINTWLKVNSVCP